MSFLEKISLGVIRNEREMLKALLEATEGWYNELTRPFLPVLTGKITAEDLSPSKQKELEQIAKNI